MTKLMYNGVNIFNPIDKKLDEILEYFVKVYGESEQDRISSRLKDTTFLFLPRTNMECSYEDLLFDCLETRVADCLAPLCKKYKVFQDENTQRYTINIERNLLKLKSEIFSENICDLSKIYLNEFAKPLGLLSVDGAYNLNQKKKILKYIEHFLVEYKEKYSTGVESIEKEHLRANQGLKKLMPDVMKLEEEQQDNIRKIKMAHFYAMLDRRKICLKGKDKKKYFNTFCQLTEYKRKVTFMPKSLDAEVQDMAKNCFMSHYKYYRQDKDLLDEIFDNNFMEKIQKERGVKREKLINQNIVLQEAIQLIDSMPFKYETERAEIKDSMVEFCLNRYPLAIQFNYIDANDNKLKSVCLYDVYLALTLETFIHEMVHVVDSSILKTYEDFFVIKSGLDELPHRVVSCVTHNVLEYEKYYDEENNFFDEFITELIAIKICKLMRNDGIDFCLANNDVCDYDAGVFAFAKLFDENQNLLLKCRGMDSLFLYKKILGERLSGAVAKLADKIIDEYPDFEKLDKSIKSKYGKKINLKDISYIVDSVLPINVEGDGYISCVKRANYLSKIIEKKLSVYRKKVEKRCKKDKNKQTENQK